MQRERDMIDQKKNYFICKRVFDLVFAGLFILFVLSWLLPILCFLLWIDNRGTVFFFQRRVGMGGKTFTCYKLRTIQSNGSISQLGLFLRKTNLDEFPQFFNVFKGDMSLVGPRPHTHSDCAKFSELLPGYKKRNLVKPGLTGLAQVKGFHGPAHTLYRIRMRFHWDTMYLQKAGMLPDCLILLQTVYQRFAALAFCMLGISQSSLSGEPTIPFV